MTRRGGMFPVTHSIVSAEALLTEAAQAYAMGTLLSCQLLQPGLNDTYLLASHENRYIARVYRAGLRSPFDIAYELELLGHLAAKGVSVSRPIADKDGSLMRPLAVPEGTRHLALFTYAEGTPISWDDEDHSYLAGRVAAAIHAASDDFVSRHARFRLDLAYLIDTPLAALRPFLAHRPDDWRYLEGLAARLRVRVEEAASAGLDWGVCHADFGPKNIHIASDRSLTVFDFDLCGPGWRAYDFAVFRWVAVGRNNSALFDSFVKGYTEIRNFAAADLAAVPLFHAICQIWSAGVFARNVAHWGTVCMSDEYLDGVLASIRKLELKNLEGS